MQGVWRSVCWLAFCVLLIGASEACAEDWPQWRGPNRDAKTTGFKAPATWPENLTKKWDVVLGNGVANPSLVGDRLYVIYREGENEVVRCLSATTGVEVWKVSYPSEPAKRFGAGNGLFVGARATPTVADGRVLTLGVNGMLTCYDAVSGAIKWRKDQFVGQVPSFYTSGSPLVVDGLCLVQLGASGGEQAQPGDVIGSLYAFDLATGDEKWRAPEAPPSYASLVAMTVDGMKVVFATSESNLLAVNVANGKVVWKIPYRQSRYNAASPIVDGQTLIFAGPQTEAGLTAVKLSKQGDELKEEEAWKYTGNNLIFNTPVLKDGAFYGISNRDMLFAVNAEHTTGWSEPIAPPRAAAAFFVPQNVFALPQQQEEGRGRGEARGEGDARGTGERRGQQRGRGRGRPASGGQQAGYGTVVDAGSVMIATCPSGDLVVFKPNAAEYSEIKRYKLSDDGEVYSHPILSGNRIYIKDRDSVSLWVVE